MVRRRRSTLCASVGMPGMLVTLLLLLATASPAWQAGALQTADGCGWDDRFTISDPDGWVRTMTVFDDGNGQDLYAGGFLFTAGGEVVDGVASWDGTKWSALQGSSLAGDGLAAVISLAVYDSGSGDNLYAGGLFTTANDETANNIARWDGTRWWPLEGLSGTGTDSWVYAMAAYDDGSGAALYVGGEFLNAGGITVNGIARWDGTQWSALTGASGTGVSGAVSALAVYDDGSGPALYVAGEFATAGGVSVNHIARWDGAEWSALSGSSGSGLSSRGSALAVHDDGSGDALYVGGLFSTAGGVTVNYIARWDGAEWSALAGPSDTGVADHVQTLTVHDDGSGAALYAGGDFSTAGGVTVSGIAKWDGSQWLALSGPAGTGVDIGGSVMTLASFDDGGGAALYAGGDFIEAGGISARYVAMWDGSQWSDLDGVDGDGVTANVLALQTHDDGTGTALYAGGEFTEAGGTAVDYIARWNGGQWSTLTDPEDGLSSWVYALAVYDDGTGTALYAGGAFSTAGSSTVNHIARWDGTQWSALAGTSGTGVSTGRVEALAVYDDGGGSVLCAGGSFASAGGITANNIACWDGSQWSALSGPSGTGVDNTSDRYNPEVLALAVYDDGSGPALFAAGDFETAGGVTVNNIAKWNGTQWSALTGTSATGVDDKVYALAVFDDGNGAELYAGGRFMTAGGDTVKFIASWNGARWRPLTSGSSTGFNRPVTALATHDDGSGSLLYVGGDFTMAADITANRIARWDGMAWSALPGQYEAGLRGGSVSSMATFNRGAGTSLYVGGWFSIAGGVPSAYIARWHCMPPPQPLFSDGFESGDTSAWSVVVP